VSAGDTLLVHNLLKEHKLVYTASASPSGKWCWVGICEIKNKKSNDTTNANLKIQMVFLATFYGSLKYDYNLIVSTGGTKVVTHDVIVISPVFLDAKSHAPSKNVNAGTYGVDWWNIYIPIPLLAKLNEDIKRATGYNMNQEGVIMDDTHMIHAMIHILVCIYVVDAWYCHDHKPRVVCTMPLVRPCKIK
jgi:hypothetical protein